MLSHETIQELLAGYALGALPKPERDAVRAHLETCSECRELYQADRLTVNLLPRAVEPVEPSAEAKHKLLARVDADLAQEQAQPAAPLPARRAAPAPGKTARRPLFARPLFAFAIVAALVALAVGGWWYWTSTAPQRQIAAILADPNVQKVALAGTKDAPGAQAEIYMVPGTQQAVLVVSGLTPLAADKGYQFWFIKGQDPQPSDVFTVNADGTRTVLVKSSAPVQDYNAWGVTIEPRAGVDKPTGPLVILGGG